LNSLKVFENQIIEIENLIIEFTYTKNIRNFNYHLSEIPHLHLEYELHFILEGECPIYVDDKMHLLKSNSVCIIPKKTEHYFPYSENDCKGFGMIMSVKHKKEKELSEASALAAEKLFKLPASLLIIENNSKINRYIHDFLDAYKDKGFGYEYILKSTLTLLFFTIFKKSCDTLNIGIRTQNVSDANSELLLETYIMNNYTKNISLKDVAEKMCFSVTHTGRIINELFGMPYSRLILELRMTRAKKKILSSDDSFAEIAKSVGFDSYNGFAKAIKRYFGKTPEQIRKEKN
jgi:AraC-like DNA-binding protein